MALPCGAAEAVDERDNEEGDDNGAMVGAVGGVAVGDDDALWADADEADKTDKTDKTDETDEMDEGEMI